MYFKLRYCPELTIYVIGSSNLTDLIPRLEFHMEHTFINVCDYL